MLPAIVTMKAIRPLFDTSYGKKDPGETFRVLRDRAERLLAHGLAEVYHPDEEPTKELRPITNYEIKDAATEPKRRGRPRKEAQDEISD